MFSCYQSCRRYSTRYSGFFNIFIFAVSLALVWSVISILLYDNYINTDGIQKSSLVFCFVLSANNRHLTSSRAIIYSSGKRCDRLYFITRLQNTSVDLMIRERFEKTADITRATVTQQTLNVLRYLENELSFSAYQWFLRATDDSFVVMPNLRRFITQLQIKKYNRALAYVGDVERMYKKYGITTSGSVMLFNRKALNRFVASYLEKRRCALNLIYDHELIICMKRIGINVNPVDDNLILSSNLLTYRMDKRLKVTEK
jgi:hypothetical protein